jgi:hypothetical protein
MLKIYLFKGICFANNKSANGKSEWNFSSFLPKPYFDLENFDIRTETDDSWSFRLCKRKQTSFS